MPNPSAAYLDLVSVAPDSSGSAGIYAQLNGLNSFDFDDKEDTVDSTYFAGAGAHAKFATLADSSWTLQGHFIPGTGPTVFSADPAQNSLIAACQPGTADRYVWIQSLFGGTGTHGPAVKALVKSFKITGKVAGVLEFNCSLEGSGVVSWS